MLWFCESVYCLFGDSISGDDRHEITRLDGCMTVRCEDVVSPFDSHDEHIIANQSSVCDFRDCLADNRGLGNDSQINHLSVTSEASEIRHPRWGTRFVRGEVVIGMMILSLYECLVFDCSPKIGYIARDSSQITAVCSNSQDMEVPTATHDFPNVHNPRNTQGLSGHLFTLVDRNITDVETSQSSPDTLIVDIGVITPYEPLFFESLDSIAYGSGGDIHLFGNGRGRSIPRIQLKVVEDTPVDIIDVIVHIY